ncbi:hypothetical protein TWF703_001853 [Orbilia oligospora]|uniref:Mitochondrial adapter protein MCP1 transmembrane domain-containing protein n=1 Tax=Orbilia oligospora TaxID=2813651 RepID=A0A7C8JNY1_ORBOL|nr:hypothetical protein TWF703_001853 [Orbilia oligospora]
MMPPSPSFANFGLQLLEPSPLTTPEASVPENPVFRAGSPEGPRRTRMTHYRAVFKSQQISSYVFTGFLGIHWFTTGILPLVSNPEAVDNSLLLSRVLYQNEFIEPCIVLGSVGTHVLSGVALRVIRRAQQYKNFDQIIWFKDLNILQGTGYLLIPTVAIHFGIIRLLPFLKDGGSESIGIKFLGHGFVQLRYLSWLIYPTLAVASTFHVVQGWARWQGYPKRWKSPTACLIAIVSGVWLASIVRISRIGRAVGHLGRHYDELYNAVLSFSWV